MYTHGLAGVGGRSAYQHSDVRSKTHEKHARTKLWDKRATFIEVRDFSHTLPRFVEGPLRTPGNLSWLVRDGKLENVEGQVMAEQLENFELKVKEEGVYRAGRKTGVKQYFQKTDAPALKRQTLVLPPWFSKCWEVSSEETRGNQKGVVISLLYKLAKERWPEVEIKALSLHDDTGNLHVDIWATELKKEVAMVRKREVVRNVHKQSFFFGNVGPGTVYLQAKQDMGHELHPEDKAKLERSLQQYDEVRTARKKKRLPEVPDAITFNRKVDRALSLLFKNPDTVKKFKGQYLQFCKRLDKVKYQVYNQIEEMQLQARELASKEMELDARRATLEEQEIEMLKVLDEIAALNAKLKEDKKELSARVDEAISKDSIADGLKNMYPRRADIEKMCIENPELADLLAKRVALSKNEYWQNFCKVVREMKGQAEILID